MTIKNIFRMAFAAGLAIAAVTTVLAGSVSTSLSPNDLFYKGSLCLHSPAALKR